MFRIEHPELGIDDNLRRAARVEFDQAMAEVAEAGFELHGTIRNVRRRLKRIRSILKLMRPVFPDYREENAALRDIGRKVGELRDVVARVEAVDLLGRLASAGAIDELTRLRQALVDRATALEATLDREELISNLRMALRAARVRSELWMLRKTDHRAIVPGLAETYRRARKGLKRVRLGGSEADFHAWRKEAKCHASQVSLLANLAPAFAEPRRRAGKKLAALLGDIQNLVILEDWLASGHHAGLSSGEMEDVQALIANEVTRLMGKAMRMGAKLFAEPTRVVRRRWRTYVDDWFGASRLA